MRFSRSAGSLIAVSLLLVLAACAVSPAPAATPTASSSTAPASDPGSPTRAALGGVCGSLISPAGVQAAVGVPVGPNDSFTGPDLLFGAVGGIGCRWAFGDQGDPRGAEISLAAVPSAVEAAAASGGGDGGWSCATNPDLMDENRGCTTTSTVAGWWYRLQVFVFTSPEGQRSSSDSVDLAIRGALSGRRPEATARRQAPDCTALGRQLDLAALGLEGGEIESRPYDGGAPDDAITPAAIAWSGVARCYGGLPSNADPDPTASVGFDVFPESLGAFESCASGSLGEPITITGARSAVVFPTDAGAQRLCARTRQSSVVFAGPTRFPGEGSDGPASWDQRHLDAAARVIAVVGSAVG